jgi:hypothetical protein
MYTNGFTGNRFLSIVWFIDSCGMTQIWMHDEFVVQSERVTLRTLDDAPGYNPYDHTLPSLLRRQAE